MRLKKKEVQHAGQEASSRRCSEPFRGHTLPPAVGLYTTAQIQVRLTVLQGLKYVCFFQGLMPEHVAR